MMESVLHLEAVCDAPIILMHFLNFLWRNRFSALWFLMWKSPAALTSHEVIKVFASSQSDTLWAVETCGEGRENSFCICEHGAEFTAVPGPR